LAIGKPAADSSNLVTSQLQGKSLIQLATELFGQTPLAWGRYFTSVASTGVVEYRHLRENQALRDKNIRVVPIARQTKRVAGSQADGSADAEANAEDLIQTFGGDYLRSLGGQVLMFLDVEGAPPLSVSYYSGWAGNLINHSRVVSNGAVTILPCVYATQADNATWTAVATAAQNGAECHGAWIARWRIRGCGKPLDFDDAIVKPNIEIPCDVLLWQYADECNGGDGFDCNEINPTIDLERDFLNKCVLPPDISTLVS
jgi:hypothetical protein